VSGRTAFFLLLALLVLAAAIRLAPGCRPFALDGTFKVATCSEQP